MSRLPQEVVRSLVFRMRSWGLEVGVIQLLLYLVVGGTCSAIDFGLFLALVGLGISPVLAAASSFIVATLINYGLARLIVFDWSRKSQFFDLILVSLVALVGLGISTATFAYLSSQFRIEGSLSKVISIGVVFAWNFLARKFLVYRGGLPEMSTTSAPRSAQHTKNER